VPVLIWVWVAIAVLAVLVLGMLGYGLLGALQRLTREVRALERALQPLRTEVRQTMDRAAAQRSGDRTSTSG
jgi:hypothetical protein